AKTASAQAVKCPRVELLKVDEELGSHLESPFPLTFSFNESGNVTSFEFRRWDRTVRPQPNVVEIDKAEIKINGEIIDFRKYLSNLPDQALISKGLPAVESKVGIQTFTDSTEVRYREGECTVNGEMVESLTVTYDFTVRTVKPVAVSR